MGCPFVEIGNCRRNRHDNKLNESKTVSSDCDALENKNTVVVVCAIGLDSELLTILFSPMRIMDLM